MSEADYHFWSRYYHDVIQLGLNLNHNILGGGGGGGGRETRGRGFGWECGERSISLRGNFCGRLIAPIVMLALGMP